jgi:hypothetical protein
MSSSRQFPLYCASVTGSVKLIAPPNDIPSWINARDAGLHQNQKAFLVRVPVAAIARVEPAALAQQIGRIHQN